jgi:cytoskeletal protein RodZ
MEIVALSFSGQMPWLTLPLAFEERNMQGRIKNMQKTKKSSAVLVIAAMLLAVLISAGCSVKPSASPVANTPSELTPPETAVDSNMQTEAPIEPTETPPAAETTPASPAEPTETPSTTEAPAEAAELPSTQATPKDIAYSYDNSFLLRLPSDWEGRYTVGYNEQAEGVIFSNKANADAGWRECCLIFSATKPGNGRK